MPIKQTAPRLRQYGLLNIETEEVERIGFLSPSEARIYNDHFNRDDQPYRWVFGLRR